ncbi:MAG: hypothetical protein JWO38_826 [Gemmataceae bacterium]|nr:hypothetical protein [Gemmataceae bacterium]
MLDLLPAPTVPVTPGHPGEFRLMCPRCSELLMFAGIQVSALVHPTDGNGDSEGCIARIAYRSGCGCEQEVQATAGCLVIIQEVAQHGDGRVPVADDGTRRCTASPVTT